jgi:hypothetical protein
MVFSLSDGAPLAAFTLGRNRSPLLDTAAETFSSPNDASTAQRSN